MTGGAVFLLVAVVLSVIGSVVLWARYRQPTSLEHGIDSFAREMEALAPEQPPRARRTASPGSADEGDQR